VCAFRRRQQAHDSSLSLLFCFLTYHHSLLPLSYTTYHYPAIRPLTSYPVVILVPTDSPTLIKCLPRTHDNHEQLQPRRRKEARHPARKGLGSYQRTKNEQCIITAGFSETWPSCEPLPTFSNDNFDPQQTTQEPCTTSSSIDTRSQAEERNTAAIWTSVER
jgi:hypothetical protein